jgi:hypothetical protein
MTDHPTDRLAELLRSSVPEPPDLDGLAEVAVRRAHRTRARRLTAVAAGAAVAVSAVLLGPAAVDRGADSSTSVESPGSTPADTSCRADTADDQVDEPQAVYVRFCPTDGRGAIVPDVILTRGAAELADALPQRYEQNLGLCVLESRNPFRIQVGYDDGTSRTITNNQSRCGGTYDLVMRAVAAQESAGLPPGDDLGPICPPVVPRGSADPSLRLDPGTPSNDPFVVLPVRAAALCTSSGTEPVRQALSPEQGEDLRIAVLENYNRAITRCATPAGPLVRFVLTLADGSTHTVETDSGCRPVSVDGTYVGLARGSLPPMIEALSR